MLAIGTRWIVIHDGDDNGDVACESGHKLLFQYRHIHMPPQGLSTAFFTVQGLLNSLLLLLHSLVPRDSGTGLFTDVYSQQINVNRDVYLYDCAQVMIVTANMKQTSPLIT